MKESILQTEKACYICGNTLNLHKPHVFYGIANRKLSDADGCVIWLCHSHHTGVRGIHQNIAVDNVIKRRMQRAWQEHYGKTKEDFIARYGKSYI